MKSRRFVIAASMLIMTALACTLGQAAPPAEEDLPGTITAQALTLQAPSSTPAPPSQTPPPAMTNTPTVPEVRVSSATNCRTGPGIIYDLLWTMKPTDLTTVVGRHSPSGYWIVNKPNGGTCWLWGEYATVSGNINSLPEFPQPPTPTASKPAAPENFKASTSCSPGQLFTTNIHVELTWTDVATNEEGYKVYRSGQQLYTLSANSTGAEDDTSFGGLIIVMTGVPSPTPFAGIKYSIRAFNGNSNSEWRELFANCP